MSNVLEGVIISLPVVAFNSRSASASVGTLSSYHKKNARTLLGVGGTLSSPSAYASLIVRPSAAWTTSSSNGPRRVSSTACAGADAVRLGLVHAVCLAHVIGRQRTGLIPSHLRLSRCKSPVETANWNGERQLGVRRRWWRRDRPFSTNSPTNTIEKLVTAQLLRELRSRTFISYVSGSDIVKFSEQLDISGESDEVIPKEFSAVLRCFSYPGVQL
jgi:hypothetical protein